MVYMAVLTSRTNKLTTEMTVLKVVMLLFRTMVSDHSHFSFHLAAQILKKTENSLLTPHQRRLQRFIIRITIQDDIWIRIEARLAPIGPEFRAVGIRIRDAHEHQAEDGEGEFEDEKADHESRDAPFMRDEDAVDHSRGDGSMFCRDGWRWMGFRWRLDRPRQREFELFFVDSQYFRLES
jgi:hypothetical protein